jgi:hypothetical protein
LNGNGVSFSALVGVAKEVTSEYNWENKEDVKFIVRDVSDENNIRVLAETGVMTRDTTYVTISADLTGVDVVEFLIDPNDDGGDWDQASWVNPNIVMKVVPADPIIVNDNAVADYSTTNYFSTATVTKGVFAMRSGASFSREVAIGANGAIAVDMTGKVSAENLNGTIDLFSTPTLTLGSGDSVEKAVFLYGPVVGYTIGTREENNETVVYARITGVADISSSRKVTVFTAGYADAEHWNDVSGNWSAGAPSKGSFDIGVFCENASINYMTGYVFSHGDFVVRGATVTVRGSNSPNLDMLRFAGSGTVLLQNASIDLRSGRALAVDAGVTINVANGTVAVGTGDSVSFAGALVIGANAKLKVYGYENAEVGVDSVLALVSHASFAEGVTAAAVAVVGHDDAIVAIEAGEGDAFVARVTKVVGETVYWVGGESGNWSDGANWDQGIVPLIIQTAVFTNSATVYRNGDSDSANVSNLVVNAGYRVELRSSDIWNVHPTLKVFEVSGEGRVALAHTGFDRCGGAASGAVVRVAELEFVDCGNDSWLQGTSESVPLAVESKIVGSGRLCIYSYVTLSGDNSGFSGSWEMGNQWGSTGRTRFTAGQAGFSTANNAARHGDSKIYLDTAEEVRFSAIDLHSDDTTVRVEATVPGARLAVSNETTSATLAGVVRLADGASLAIRKLGEGTLTDGLIGAYSLNVEKGHVQLSADNANVSATVAAGASIGSAADVTIGSVVFANGAKVLQTYDSTTPAMPVLTLTGDYDVSVVLFGVTNPADLPAATKEATQFTMLTATGTLSGTPATDAIYKPEGSAAGMKWAAAKSGNSVILKTLSAGFVVIVL